jgi:DNA-directed RNA polymerase subunit RPC12/RpoP
MRKCKQCNGRLRRIHRTFLERFSYMAIYGCPKCQTEEFVPRRYTYHLGEHARCPRCGSFRPSKLRELDKIDKMNWGILNLWEQMAGGRLYHCCFCRIQFYDRRSLAEKRRGPETIEVEPPQPVASAPDSTPSSV